MATTNNPVTVPAVRLAALATRLRDLADKATPGPWYGASQNRRKNGYGIVSAKQDGESAPIAVLAGARFTIKTRAANTALIATMNPAVALALADLVDAAVNDHAAIYEADCYCRDGATCDNLDALLPLADLILGADT